MHREMVDELTEERRKNQLLHEEVQQLKDLVERNNIAAEADHENISNKLNSKLNQIILEKERLAQEVEREEEFISNTLQKQLMKLRNEKIKLENDLEQEQECMVNKLQRQVMHLENEKNDLSAEHKRVLERIDEIIEASSSCACDCSRSLAALKVNIV